MTAALPDGRHATRHFTDDAADDTRQAILAAGHQIFCERAYSDVSGLQISKAAGVTRGGLQYHFDSKQGLFLAVFERLQHQVVERVRAAIGEHTDPVEQARAGIAAFLDGCAEHDYQAVVLKAGPAAIGWQRFRELDNKYFGELVQALIDTRAATGLVDDARHLLAAVIRGALTELSFEIAESANRAQAHAQALTLIEHVLGALARPQTAAAGYGASGP